MPITLKEAIENKDAYSPMMQNYLETKSKYMDCVLFYRLGDFYELFFDDAVEISKKLELTLTGKECGQAERAPMCGIPYHAGEGYATKLIQFGYKVAICEQLEEAKNTKGIVKRDVVKIMTPGTITDGALLDDKNNNYIMSIYKSGLYYGIASFDISTGNAYSAEIKTENNFNKLINEISRFKPAEIVVNELMSNSKTEIDQIKKRFDIFISIDDKIESFDQNENFVPDFFNMKTKSTKLDTIFDENTVKTNFEIVNEKNEKITDIEDRILLVHSVNILFKYIQHTQKLKPDNLNKIVVYDIQKYMDLDVNTRKHLELTERLKDKNKKGSLLWVLDKTETSMGGRLLRRWINDPLIDVDEINKRLESVEEIKQNLVFRDMLTENLKKIYDIERISGKIAYGTANARDLITLKNSIEYLPELKKTLERAKSNILTNFYQNIDTLDDLYDIINTSIEDNPPLTLKEGGLIKKGYKKEIDELIEASSNAKKWLVETEAREKELTGIKTLKIGYNKVFGYFIEVSKGSVKEVPEDRYIRKQTLTNGERYITEELKNMENYILGSKERVIQIEYEEFVEIRNSIQSNAKRIQKTANIVAIIDVLTSFAKIAAENSYVKPEVNNSDEINILEGRHPVIEKIVESGSFVSNSTKLDSNKNRLGIITGPNMAGKSTYMRQIALIVIMAQIGSFVPADFAKIGIVDKIFTRIGASDDLSMGESTFMVEMMEVANILKNATEKSLIILDEIGRGTSTYDGLSIAHSVAEYVNKIRAKTLFATHYHELVRLEDELDGTKNYHITVKEKGDDIVFLRKIVDGGTDESYGIHVAKLAGVPKEVTNRANDILKTMEKKDIIIKKEKKDDNQIDMFNFKLAEIAHELDKLKLEDITPIEALNILQKMKGKLV